MLVSAIAFITFMSVVAVREKNKTGHSILFRDAIRSGSTWAVVYTQFEYFLTIITTQGDDIAATQLSPFEQVIKYSPLM